MRSLLRPTPSSRLLSSPMLQNLKREMPWMGQAQDDPAAGRDGPAVVAAGCDWILELAGMSV